MQVFLLFLSMIFAQPTDLATTANYAGDWDYEVESPDMTYKGTMSLSEEDGEYSGTMSSQGVDIELKDVVVEDNELTCSMNVQGFACNVEITFDGDKMSGTVTLPDMGLELPLKGSRAE